MTRGNELFIIEIDKLTQFQKKESLSWQVNKISDNFHACSVGHHGFFSASKATKLKLRYQDNNKKRC